jgi:hypothetical protein
METRQLNGPIFMLGALAVATSLYVCCGAQTQETLLDLSFLLLATVFVCYFIFGVFIALIRKKLRRNCLRNYVEIDFATLQGIIALPVKMYKAPKNGQPLSSHQLKKLEQNRLRIRNIILSEAPSPQATQMVAQKVSTIARKIDNSISLELADLV